MGLNLSEEFESLVTEISRQSLKLDGKNEEERLYKGIALYFFAKGRKTYQSIKLLCLDKLAEDASVLTRSLFEMVVDLVYVGQEPSRRVLYCEYEIIQKVKLHRKLEEGKKKNDPWCIKILASKGQAQLEAELKEYERVKGNYPNKDRWSGESRKDIAEKIGMGWQYNYVYFILSALAHTSPTAVDSYLRFNTSGTLEYRNSEPGDVERVWNTASIYFLIIINCLNDAFRLCLDDKIKKIDDLIQREFPTCKGGGES